MVNPGQSNIRPTDLHRVFLQTMLSRRVDTEEVLVELYKRCVSACQSADENFRPTHAPDKQGARSFFKDINRILEQGGMQMELKSLKDEDNHGKDMWALINLDASDEASAMTDYEPIQISFFKLVANKIIESYPDNSIGSNDALSLTSQVSGQMAKSAALVLLGTFVARGWLNCSKRGRYSLAARAIMELDSWLMTDYEDYIKKCGRCSKNVFTGVICSNEECDAHLHKTCYSVLITVPVPKCPVCSQVFEGNPPKPLGEKAVPKAQDRYIQKEKTKRKRGSNAKAGPSRNGGDDEEEDELEDDDENGSDEEVEPAAATPSKSKWKTANGRKKTRPASESDDDE